MLEQEPSSTAVPFEEDEHCLALIPHYASLVPIAQQAHKPIFDLKQADGIGGGQIQAVARCRINFTRIAENLVKHIGIETR